MAGHALFITHRTQAGKRDAVRDVWLKHMAPTIDGNDGHEAYFYCFDTEDGDVLRVFQLYRDEAAADAFLEHPSYQEYLLEVEGLLAGPPEVHAASPQWTKRPG